MLAADDANALRGSATLLEVVRRAESIASQVETTWLGSVSVRDFCHYASAAGDDEYVVAAVALEQAGERVRAPDLFISGVFSFSYGPPESELNESGIDRSGSPCTDGLEVFQVHGGATVRLHAPVWNGDVLRAHRAVRSAELKEGQSGEFVVLTWATQIESVENGLVCSVVESLIVRGVGRL